MITHVSAEESLVLQSCTTPYRQVRSYLDTTVHLSLPQITDLLVAHTLGHHDADHQLKAAHTSGRIVCEGEPGPAALARALRIHVLQKIEKGDIEAASFALGQRFPLLFPASPTVNVTSMAQEASKVEHNQPVSVRNTAEAMDANLVKALTEQQDFAAVVDALKFRPCRSASVLGPRSKVSAPSQLTLWVEQLLQSSLAHALTTNGGSKDLHIAEGKLAPLLYMAIRERAQYKLANQELARAAKVRRWNRWLSSLRCLRCPKLQQRVCQIRRVSQGARMRALAAQKYGTTPAQAAREALVHPFRGELEKRDQQIENDPLYVHGAVVLNTGIEILNELLNAPIEVTQFLPLLDSACPTGGWSKQDLLFAVAIALATRALKSHRCIKVKQITRQWRFQLTLLRSVLDTSPTTLDQIGELYLHADRQVGKFFEELSASASA